MNLSRIVEVLGSERIERLPGLVRRRQSARPPACSPPSERQTHAGGNVPIPERPWSPPPPAARVDGVPDPR